MTDIIVIAVVVAIVGGASAYIWRQKKSGARCVGCSHASTCGKAEHSTSCQCGCQSRH